MPSRGRTRRSPYEVRQTVLTKKFAVILKGDRRKSGRILTEHPTKQGAEERIKELLKQGSRW